MSYETAIAHMYSLWHELSFFLSNYGDLRHLHSFPTRRSSDLLKWLETNNLFNNLIQRNQSAAFSSGKECRSEERFSRNAETDLVCRLLLEKKNRRSSA